MASHRDLSLLRIAAQRVAGPGDGEAAGAVRWMTAVQAQDLAGARTSIALRTAERSLVSVDAALDAGEVVRSWPMRGTLHLVAAEDLGWMLTLGPPRQATSMARRRRQLDLGDATVDRARDIATEALEGAGRLSRDDLVARWEAHEISTTGGRGYHLLVNLAHEGTVCFGPISDGAQDVVLVEDWITRPRRLEPDEARREWVRRYFMSHGPARAQDFAWWSGLTVTDAKRALAELGDQLETITVDGVDHWMDPATPDRLAACRDEAEGVLLLPGFDELVLGYQERGAVLPVEFADRLVPGGNGVFQPSIVADGRIVGTWKRPRRAGADGPDMTPFTPFSAPVRSAITARFAELPTD